MEPFVVPNAPPQFEARLLSVLRNDGRAAFSFARTIVLTGRPAAIAAADLDGEGKGDLIAGIQLGQGNLEVYTNATALAASPDCNGNGVPDACDLESGRSADEDQDGVPDECASGPAVVTLRASRTASSALPAR